MGFRFIVVAAYDRSIKCIYRFYGYQPMTPAKKKPGRKPRIPSPTKYLIFIPSGFQEVIRETIASDPKYRGNVAEFMRDAVMYSYINYRAGDPKGITGCFEDSLQRFKDGTFGQEA